VISGGTVLASGGSLVTQGGTLSGVTSQGVLALAGYYQSLSAEGGLTLQTAAGGSPGNIDLSADYYSGISMLDSETPDNATLTFGGGYGDSLSTGTGTDSGHTLTLGSSFTIDVSGGNNYLGYQGWSSNDAGDTLDNAGLISVSGGALTIDYGTFVNTGSISVTGGTVNLGSVTTVQLGAVSVSGSESRTLIAALLRDRRHAEALSVEKAETPDWRARVPATARSARAVYP